MSRQDIFFHQQMVGIFFRFTITVFTPARLVTFDIKSYKQQLEWMELFLYKNI